MIVGRLFGLHLKIFRTGLKLNCISTMSLKLDSIHYWVEPTQENWLFNLWRGRPFGWEKGGNWLEAMHPPPPLFSRDGGWEGLSSHFPFLFLHVGGIHRDSIPSSTSFSMFSSLYISYRTYSENQQKLGKKKWEKGNPSFGVLSPSSPLARVHPTSNLRNERKETLVLVFYPLLRYLREFIQSLILLLLIIGLLPTTFFISTFVIRFILSLCKAIVTKRMRNFQLLTIFFLDIVFYLRPFLHYFSHIFIVVLW